MNYSTKIKGSALFYALMISMVVGIICTAFVLLRFTHLKENSLIGGQLSLLSSVKSASALVKTMGHQCPQGWVDLFEEQKDSVFIRSGRWGAYTFGYVRAQSHGHFEEQTLLYGSSLHASEKVALCMLNRYNNLSVCGNTRLVGKVMCPNASVKRAYIEGQNYTGEKLVYGEILESPKSLPAVSEEFLTGIQELSISQPSDSLVYYNSNIKEYRQSFEKPTLRVRIIEDSIRLTDVSFSGNVILESLGTIVYSADVTWENSLCFASDIFIEPEFKGKGQFFVRQHFQCDSLLTLDYPSFIGNFETDVSSDVVISIGKKSSVSGGMCLTDLQSSDGLISMSEQSFVRGLIYSEDAVEIKQSMKGSVFCSRIYLGTSAAKYYNHLLNAELDATALRQDFWIPGIFQNEEWNEMLAL
jgi:hypothetical protein